MRQKLLDQFHILLFILSVLFDLLLFISGFSFRFFFYETLGNLFRAKNIYVDLFIFCSINLLKVLSIFFSVNIFSIFDQVLSQYLFFFLALTFFVFAIKMDRQIISMLLMLIIIMSVDKTIAKDRLLTSILYSSFHSTFLEESKKIASTVHKRVHQFVSSGPTILVNWESLGIPVDKTLVQKILVDNEGLNFEIVNVTSRATIASEYEYICGVSIGLEADLSDCVSKLGTSLALHGNVSYIFNRGSVYADMGFEKTKFKNDFSNDKNCFYSFIGVCDKWLFEEAFRLAKSAQYDFIYLLSLDGHFPYAKFTSHSTDLYRELEGLIATFTDCCSEYYSLIIVGDHPPPLAEEFVLHEIPLFYIKAKKNNQGN